MQSIFVLMLDLDTLLDTLFRFLNEVGQLSRRQTEAAVSRIWPSLPHSR
jgi:hypothetical protein